MTSASRIDDATRSRPRPDSPGGDLAARVTDRSPHDRLTSDRPTPDRTAGDRTPADRPTADRGAGERTTGAYALGDVALAQRPLERSAPDRLPDRTVTARPATAPAPARPARGRRLGAIRRGRVVEAGSVTDARARVVDLPTRADAPASGLRHSVRGPHTALLATDVVAAVVAVVLVGLSAREAALAVVTLIGTRAVLRHYRRRLHLAVLDDVPRLVGATLAGVGLAVAVDYVATTHVPNDDWLLPLTAVFLVLGLVLQAVVFGLTRRRRARGRGRRTLVIGGGPTAATLGTALLDNPGFGLVPVGVVDPGATGVGADPRLPSLGQGPATDLPRLIARHRVQTVILALGADGEDYVDTAISIHQTGADILLVPSMFELHHDGPDVERIRGVPLLRLRSDPTSRPSWWVKRSVDVLAGVLGLLVLAVPMAVVAAAILLESGRPVLFWQERVGLDGTVFRLCKFRSMRPRDDRESQTQWNIAADPRVSKLGRILRRTSVDELPQLWNIVRGQMSLVGPRPERPTFVEKFSAEHDRYWARHRVPVGLTGLSQVSGLRGDTSIRERARYDNYYIANWSLWLDIKVLLLTAREVFGGRGR